MTEALEGIVPPKGMKCALSLLGVCSGVMADPLTQFNPPEQARVRALLEELGLLPGGAAPGPGARGLSREAVAEA